MTQTEQVELDSLPKGNSYAYHISPKDCVDSILKRGILPDSTTDENWKSVNDFIKEVSIKTPDRIPIQIDRNNSVYLFERRTTPTSFISNNTENSLLCVNLSKTECNFFVADMEPVTELVKEYKRNPDIFDMDISNPSELSDREQGTKKLALRHIDSITNVSDPCSEPPIDAYDVEWITMQTIPPESITHIAHPD